MPAKQNGSLIRSLISPLFLLFLHPRQCLLARREDPAAQREPVRDDLDLEASRNPACATLPLVIVLRAERPQQDEWLSVNI
jgi:hypothetical protein